MDELRGPTIQIVLHIKEGLGFGFLKNPFLVSGFLNGYLLETDPAVPSHAPTFDAELVWEADKRRFRNLRVQNVPIKVEVYTMSSQSRKDKIGYILLSLLSAQPCPTNKHINVKNVWHRLLGVKAEGKCCHPQLLLSLTVEDRTSTPTPRNELRMFHCNEVAYLSNYPETNMPTLRVALQTYDEYIKESEKQVSSADLQPKLISEEGLIQIGENCKHLFVLSFVIGSAENVDMLLPDHDKTSKESSDCYVTYSVFTHNIMTDRVAASVGAGSRCIAQFNQRTSLRLCTDLRHLTRYFSECPYVVTKFCTRDTDVGVCSMDLRKLVPTEDVKFFVENFCNMDKTFMIQERCYFLNSDKCTHRQDDKRKPFIDIEMSLHYLGVKRQADQKAKLTARSASQLPTNNINEAENIEKDLQLDFKSGSCTEFDHDIGGVAYTNMTARNTNRYKNVAGDASLQTDEIADIIKKMCDAFTLSQQKLLTSRVRPSTSDMQVQCNVPVGEEHGVADVGEEHGVADVGDVGMENTKDGEEIKLDSGTSALHIINTEKEKLKLMISASERETIMQKYINELEDWKEKQQDLYKCQLQRKEDYHLEMLSKEWSKRRLELESKLSRGIEQCRNLASDLSRATDDFRLRGFRNTEREKKLIEAKKALEQHYTAKYQELRDASQKMEDDMNHRLKLKDMRIEELLLKMQQMDKKVDDLKNNLKNIERDSENKYSGLTKDQTANLIQELRCLEEKLDTAVQSKSFFKEQWGRAVRELHITKLNNRKQMLTQLQQDRKELGDLGLDTMEEEEKLQNEGNFNQLKDDFYVDILANTPALESHSMISDGTGGVDMFTDLRSISKNSMNEKLNDLIRQRDKLVTEDCPNEDKLAQLNQEIRNILLNYGT